MKAQAAVYTGSFDPITLGHLNVIERGCSLFDKLIIGVGINVEKTPLFTPEERVELIKRVTCHLPAVEVHTFDGLAVHTGPGSKTDRPSANLAGCQNEGQKQGTHDTSWVAKLGETGNHWTLPSLEAYLILIAGARACTLRPMPDQVNDQTAPSSAPALQMDYPTP